MCVTCIRGLGGSGVVTLNRHLQTFLKKECMEILQILSILQMCLKILDLYGTFTVGLFKHNTKPICGSRDSVQFYFKSFKIQIPIWSYFGI